MNLVKEIRGIQIVLFYFILLLLSLIFATLFSYLVPNNDAFRQSLISRIGKLVSNMRWKATFFLKPETKPANLRNV